MDGVEALQMPEFEFASDRVYRVDGEVVRQVTTKARKPVLPMFVKGRTTSEFFNNMRIILNAMNPKRGEGALKVYTADGKTRVLNCRLYEAPIQETADTGRYNPRPTREKGDFQWRMFPITFFAADPHWYDPLEREAYWGMSSGAGYYDLTSPIVLHNEGDVNTWPIWAITGKCSVFTIRNLTTGKFISATIALTDSGSVGCRLYIDTRPLINTVRLDHITNKFNSTSTGSNLFPLVPGANVVQASFSGLTSGTSKASIRVRWVNRYQGL
jgi:Siphovirus-type tail component, C-terminal domain